MWSDAARRAAAEARKGAHAGQIDKLPKSGGIDPLRGMTQDRWNAMSPVERESVRDNSGLNPQLSGLEGHLVEVKDDADSAPRKFVVGKSTGWRPVHLEVPNNRRSTGGAPAGKYFSVRSLGQKR